MKKAAIIPAMALFSAMLVSCNLFPDFSLQDPNANNNLPDNLEEGFFYAQNTTSGRFYTLEAEIKGEGERCVIWAEIDSGVTPEQAEDIARVYDNKIRKEIVDTFSAKNFIVKYQGKDYPFKDVLDYANWLTNGNDEKLTILLLDIKDGYRDESDTYVAGYFYSGDFLRKGKNRINNRIYYSNGRDMIYVDIEPGLRLKPEQAYSTFAHELQHLVNYVTCILLDKATTDVWVNEGLSAYAEYIHYGKNPEEKCVWLNDSRNTVKTGNNFFVWGNHKDKPYAIMDDYATVYLFFRWLYLQADPGLQSRIFRDITSSGYSDYRAVTSVVGSDWEPLLKKWFAANHDPKNAVYGYKNDPYLQEGYGTEYPQYYKGVRITPMGGKTVPLYPGEGVYSIFNNNSAVPVPVAGENIRYEELAGNTTAVKMLLTFNANKNNKGGRETGSLTGVSSIATSRTAADDPQPIEWNGPFVIDAQDLLGRDQERLIFRVPR